jgi:hypothetical protein
VQYFTFAFRIDLDEWSIGPKLLEYLRWIIRTFQQRQSAPPAFQFIFVVTANELHRTPHDGAAALRDFVQQLNFEHQNEHPDAPKRCTWLEAFEPVPPTDIETWLRNKYKSNPDIPKIRKVVQQFADNLRQSERWDGKSGMDMAEVEAFTKLVFAVSHDVQ